LTTRLSNDGQSADPSPALPQDRIATIRMELEKQPARPTVPGEPNHPDIHMDILQALLEMPTPGAAPGLRRGVLGQQPRRELEQVVRLRAVELANHLGDLGHSPSQAAQRLAIPKRTLRHWMQLHLTNMPAALGRPLCCSGCAQHAAVWSCIDVIGPGVGLPVLRRRFGSMARAELDDILRSYRRQWRSENARWLHVLDWQRPGSIWAMDFAAAPSPIDGLYPYLLAVRDLASGQQLLWQPVTAPITTVVLGELRLLFALHGAPLVLKSDNGSAFIADELRWYLDECRVVPLFSPPRTPSYNGAIEASIGSLKNRTEQQAEEAGQPGVWTSAHVEAALAQSNTSRPRRLKGLTPDQVWSARRFLTAGERARFELTVEQCRREERDRQGLPGAEPLPRNKRAAVDRIALRRALVAHDLLLFRRRRIPAKITRPNPATKG
jgi:transposase InsO family protein